VTLQGKLWIEMIQVQRITEAANYGSLADVAGHAVGRHGQGLAKTQQCALVSPLIKSAWHVCLSDIGFITSDVARFVSE
jgi:hypothetical protein